MRCRTLLAVMLLAVPVASMAAAESIDAIEARLDAAEAVRAAKRLQNAYGHYLQAGRWNDAAALPTDGSRKRHGGIRCCPERNCGTFQAQIV